MKKRVPAAGINQTTSNTVERVAKIAVKFLIWRINLTKIHSCAYSTFATSRGSTMRRATSRSATSRCGDIMCIRFIRCVTTHFSAICVADWRVSKTLTVTSNPPSLTA